MLESQSDMPETLCLKLTPVDRRSQKAAIAAANLGSRTIIIQIVKILQLWERPLTAGQKKEKEYAGSQKTQKIAFTERWVFW